MAKGQFTGTYNQCNLCGHIWDFDDVCPECGDTDVIDISISEIKEIVDHYSNLVIELTEILNRHGDL